jgi:hypothetical protein
MHIYEFTLNGAVEPGAGLQLPQKIHRRPGEIWCVNYDHHLVSFDVDNDIHALLLSLHWRLDQSCLTTANMTEP